MIRRWGARVNQTLELDAPPHVWYPTGMPEQPREGYAITIRFPPDVERGLDLARRSSGVGPTDYIRLAVWQALVRDGFAVPPREDDRSRDAIAD